MDLLSDELIREIGYFLNVTDYNNFIQSFNLKKSNFFKGVQYIAFENVKNIISKKNQGKFILNYSNLTFKEFEILLSKGCESMCCKILKTNKKIDPSAQDNWAIRYASQFGHDKVVELLLNHPQVDPSAKNNLAIKRASRKGHLEVIKLLLVDPRVDPSAQCNLVIRYASENGHHLVIELLLKDPRVDPSANNNLAIKLASMFRHHLVVKLLLTDPRVNVGNIKWVYL